jgi:SAM-dependent methyltransferase
MSTPSSDRQAAHYDRIIDDYDRHYYDEQSLEYRRRFILEPLFEGLDFNGKRVAELASGSGHTSLYLKERFPTVELEGYDISPEAARRYSSQTGCAGHVLDLTKQYADSGAFDVAIMMGGLHHCVSDLPSTLKNVSRMIKPGGSFLMMEPNADYFLQFVRKLWYRLDHYFDAGTEDALSHQALLEVAQADFSCLRLHYFGGPAFFLIYNSLVFRLPHGVKRIIAPPMMQLERAYSLIPARWAYASFTAHWIRK